MVRLLTNRRLAAIVLAVATCIAVPAQAQGLGLDLDGSGSGADVGGDNEFGAEAAAVDLSLKSGRVGVVIKQELALEAVRKRRALPLEDIMLRAKLLTDGEVIDARLISIDNILLYELKVLGKAGEVSQLFFYARSGAPVETS